MLKSITAVENLPAEKDYKANLGLFQLRGLMALGVASRTSSELEVGSGLSI